MRNLQHFFKWNIPPDSILMLKITFFGHNLKGTIYISENILVINELRHGLREEGVKDFATTATGKSL